MSLSPEGTAALFSERSFVLKGIPKEAPRTNLKLPEKFGGVFKLGYPDDPYNPPFLQPREHNELTTGLHHETFGPADPENRGKLIREAQKTLSRDDKDFFIKGGNFIRFTTSMIDLLGGEQSKDTNEKIATLDNPFDNVRKVTFHRGDAGSKLGAFARISIETNDPQPTIREFAYNINTPGSSLNTIVETTEYKKDSQDGNSESSYPQKLTEGHDQTLDKLNLSERNVGSILNKIFDAYMRQEPQAMPVAVTSHDAKPVADAGHHDAMPDIPDTIPAHWGTEPRVVFAPAAHRVLVSSHR